MILNLYAFHPALVLGPEHDFLFISASTYCGMPVVLNDSSDKKHQIRNSISNLFLFLSGAMMPYFPENVENVTVQIGLSAELRCKVENLNNYKVHS